MTHAQPEALRIAELENHLKFVERWAVHYGTKPHMTAEEVLGIIQHYPAIVTITDSSADGERPDTFDPYVRIAELEAELVREAQRTAAEKLRADQMTEQHRMQSTMNAEARDQLATIELNGPQVTRVERVDGTPVMSTMRQAWFDAQQAAAIEARRGDELESKVGALESVLAACRDAFDIPEVNAPIETRWAAAMADPESVCEYVKASIAQLREKRQPLSFNQANEVVSKAQIAFCLDKYTSFELAVVRETEAAHTLEGHWIAHG